MKCIFTGKDANSSEHVIPLWLQTRFNLSEQTLRIPNGTTLKYKHHRVPADAEANKRFGAIENRISRGNFDPAEVYLWALKIHIGCVYRDASLRFDVKDPRSPFILDVSNFAHDVWLFQQMFQNWSNGGTTNPSPFGSVFILDSPHPTPQFDFIHCNMTGVVGIDIGGKFILVFLWDQCDAMYTNIRDQWDRWDAPRVKSLGYTGGFNIAHRVWVCESAYWLYRHRRSLSIIKTPTQIVLVPPVWRPEGKPMEEAEYRYVCRNFSLDLVQYNGEVSNVYRPLQDFTAVPRSSAIK